MATTTKASKNELLERIQRLAELREEVDAGRRAVEAAKTELQGKRGTVSTYDEVTAKLRRQAAELRGLGRNEEAEKKRDEADKRQGKGRSRAIEAAEKAAAIVRDLETGLADIVEQANAVESGINQDLSGTPYEKPVYCKRDTLLTDAARDLLKLLEKYWEAVKKAQLEAVPIARAWERANPGRAIPATEKASNIAPAWMLQKIAESAVATYTTGRAWGYLE